MGKAKNVSYDGTLIKFTSHVEKNCKIFNSAGKGKANRAENGTIKKYMYPKDLEKRKNTENFGQLPRPYLLARF